MFTGLIREIGRVIQNRDNKLKIVSNLTPSLGDSIAVNGVCLTVIDTFKGGFFVEVADETRKIIPFEKFEGRVHLEPAMKMGERFEGHIVQGHIDTIGVIKSITKGENGVEFIIEVDKEVSPYLIPKGSIAVDGVSLTINSVRDNIFSLMIIPHTMQNTLFKDYGVGSKLNIETDLFARYVANILKSWQKRDKTLSWQEIDSISLSY